MNCKKTGSGCFQSPFETLGFVFDMQSLTMDLIISAGRDAETYIHKLSMDHELLQQAKRGDSVVLWARANYPGWENRVYSASIEVWCVDDLSGDMSSTT